MGTLIVLELRKNAKGIFTLALATSAMVVVSMLFFPTISKNLSLLGDFLNSGFMKGVMTAFNVDVFAMKTLLGFFSGYCTMWVVLIGSVIFAYLGSEWLAKEERTGTITFLLSKPLTRQHIFISKGVALFLSCIAFMSIVGVSGLVAISFHLEVAPYSLDMSEYNDALEKELIAHSDELSATLKLTDADFQQFAMMLLRNQYEANTEAINEAGIDVESIMALLKDDLANPEALFEKLKEDPVYYRDLLGIDTLTNQAFIDAVEQEQKAYLDLKTTFLTGENQIKDLLPMNPAYFLNYWIEREQVERVDGILDQSLTQSYLISQFNPWSYLTLMVKMFLVVLANGYLGLIAAAVYKDAATISQRVMVVVLTLYFVNSLSEINQQTSWLHYLTPFGYVDTASKELNSQPLILGFTLLIGLYYALRRYRLRAF